MIRRNVIAAFTWNIQPYLKKKFRILKDKRGIALPLFVTYLVVILLCFALVIDFGNILITRHKMQTIADAASLAGASMTKVNGIYDAFGNPIGYTAVVDLTAARSVAEAIIQENVDQLDLAGAGITINNEIITSPASDEVYVELQYEVKTLLLGGIDRVTPIRTLTMRAKSKAELRL